MIKRFESLIKKTEESYGIIVAAVLVALVLMLIAAVYVRPAVETVALGRAYASLSNNPFSDSPNSVGFRILTPLISYMLGLRGNLVIVTNLIMALTFLILTYSYFRKNLNELSHALFATSVFAFSLVTLTTIYYGGYCDSLTYIIVLLMWIYRRNVFRCSFLFLLGLLNRESIAFLLPWFVFLHISESGSKGKCALRALSGYSLAFVLYFVFRLWISSFKEVAFTTDFYFGALKETPFKIFHKTYGYQILGFFSVFKAFWIVVIISIWALWKERQYLLIFSMTLLLSSVWFQIFFAWDTSRLMTLAFPVMLISIIHSFKDNILHFRSWCWAVLVLNFIVPQFYTSGQILEYMNSTIGKLLDLFIKGQVKW